MDAMRALVLQGAVVTPAAMRENYPRTCPECDEIGYHDHVYWCCPAVAEKLGRRPQELEDWWQRRFGWPLATAGSEREDEEVIDWMVKVTQLIWERRYNNASKTRRTESHIAIRKAQREEADRALDELGAPDAEYEWLIREANQPEHPDEEDEEQH